jgi:hypothetical protein
MKDEMGHLARMAKPGGKVLIGDFSFPQGSWPQRVAQRLYYFLSMFSIWLFGGTTLHPIYDYPQYFHAVNLQTTSILALQSECALASFCRDHHGRKTMSLCGPTAKPQRER